MSAGSLEPSTVTTNVALIGIAPLPCCTLAGMGIRSIGSLWDWPATNKLNIKTRLNEIEIRMEYSCLRLRLKIGPICVKEIFEMTLDRMKDIATCVGIAFGLATYFTNSYFQFRNKHIENVKRYFDALDKLYTPDGLLMSSLETLETQPGEPIVPQGDESKEKQFIQLLIEIEKIAYLTSYGAVPATLQVYMFGWFAQKLGPQLSEYRNNKFWELAIHYIDELKKATDDYMLLPREKRDKYLKKNALVYQKYCRDWKF